MTGGPLGTQTFQFHSFSLHWGNDNARGSEHTIDSKRFPLEIHLVHFNQKYSSFGDAISQPDGLAVLGIMADLKDPDSCTAGTDEVMSLSSWRTAISTLMSTPGTPATQSGVQLDSLFPTTNFDLQRYYSYPGGLTTPPCSESVTWIILKDTDKFKTCTADEVIFYNIVFTIYISILLIFS